MQIQLHCPYCVRSFTAPPDAGAQDILARMSTQEALYALGEGETFEDMIFSTLTEEGAIRCPDCFGAVQVSEESLGRLAMEMLTHW